MGKWRLDWVAVVSDALHYALRVASVKESLQLRRALQRQWVNRCPGTICTFTPGPDQIWPAVTRSDAGFPFLQENVCWWPQLGYKQKGS